MKKRCAARVGLSLLGAACILGAPACASHPGPYAKSSSTALASLADGLSNFTLTVDFAAARANKTGALVLEKAEASATPDVRDAMQRIDQIEAHAGGSKASPSVVAALWGRMPKDPKELALLGAERSSFIAAPRLASGVDEYVGQGGRTHLFVPSSSVWVFVQGPKEIDIVRDHFTRTRDIGAPPTGDLLRLEVTEGFLRAGAGQDLRGLSSFKAVVEPNAAAIQAEATFRDAARATEVKTAVHGFATLMLAGIAMKSKECKALDKLAIDVKTEGNAVRIAVRGLDTVAEAWDPASCPKLDDEDGRTTEALGDEPSRAAPVPPTKPAQTICAVAAAAPTVRLVGTSRKGAATRAPRKLAVVAREVHKNEFALTSTVRGMPARKTLLPRTLIAYRELGEAVRAECKTDANAVVSEADAMLVEYSASRVRELCKTLKSEYPKSRVQCAR